MDLKKKFFFKDTPICYKFVGGPIHLNKTVSHNYTDIIWNNFLADVLPITLSSLSPGT